MLGPQCCEDGVYGYGPIPAKIAFIGIAPGADEYKRSKRPLTGPSGKLLDAVLEAVGIPRSEVYCTNLVHFWEDKPSPDQIAHCSARLKWELEQVKPEIVVLLGKIACESILNMPFGKARGAIIVRNNITYLATYHPAASLHKGITAAEKEVQINAAYDLCRDLSKLPTLPTNYKAPIHTLISNSRDAQIILDDLVPKNGHPIAIDIETNFDKEYDKSHPFDNDIVCIGIGWDSDHAFVFTQEAIQNLRWPALHYVFHNGAFDTQEIARHTGQWLPIGDDTMLMSYSCDERSIRGLHKLKSLAREFCGSDFYEEDDHGIKPHKVMAVGQDGKLVERDFDLTTALNKLYEYNAKDVVYTWRLHKYLKDWQQREQVVSPYRQLMLPAAEMLARSQLRGIYISPKNMLEVIEVFEPQYEKAQDDLAAMAAFAGFPDLNVNSPKQLMAMFEAEGTPLANTRKATLQDLLDTEDNPFVTTLLRYRTLHKLIRNYLLDIQKHVKNDSRVHAHAFLIGTSTGRLTYKDPALQTLPKPKTVKDLGVIRKIFSATNDNYILLEVDYAQIEAWLGAYFSHDAALLADLSSSDWHSQVAESMFNVTKDTVEANVWAFYRDAAKHINYGSMYGEEAQGLTRRPPIGIGCDLATAKSYLAAWRAHYPTFVQYQKDCMRQAQDVGYITTPFGRKRRFPLIVNDHQLRQAVNYQLQSVASDYTLSSAIRLQTQLIALDTHLLFIEHDALYYEVNKSNLQEGANLIRSTMETPPLPGLPSIKTEIDIGPNLAELSRMK